MDIPLRKFDLTGQQFKRNPFPTFEAMRESGPFVRTKIPIIGKVHFAVSYDACSELLKNPGQFTVDYRKSDKRNPMGLFYLSKTMRVFTQSMLAVDDPDHRRLRQFTDQAFHARSIEPLGDRIALLADRLLEKWVASGAPDFVDSVARRLPLLVICDILGLPEEDQDEFISWMAPISEVRSFLVVFSMIPLLKRIMKYLRARIALCRANPGEDLISTLVHLEKDGDRLTDDELVAMIFLLFVAGHETTTHLISGSVEALLAHPAQLEFLKADWTHVPAAVEELLRYVCPVQMTKPRFALGDYEIAGVEVKKGDMCMALLASANADPDHFTHPKTMNLSREKNRHLAFGAGPHLCLGLHLARLETQIILRRLFERYPNCRLKIPEAGLQWTRRSGVRALRSLPLETG